MTWTVCGELCSGCYLIEEKDERSSMFLYREVQPSCVYYLQYLPNAECIFLFLLLSLSLSIDKSRGHPISGTFPEEERDTDKKRNMARENVRHHWSIKKR